MTNISKLLRRRHYNVRRHDKRVEKSNSQDVDLGGKSVLMLMVSSRGTKRNTRNKLHWKNDATGEQRIFNNCPDHMGIYP